MATIHLFSLLLSPIFITTIHATSIPITNAGFESDRPNCTANTYWFNNGRVIGWTLYDPHNIITRDYNVGIANPQDGDAMNDPIYGSSPPEGNAVSWIVPSDDEGDGECGIQQTLSATLTPDTIYTLTAKVGNPGNNCWDDSMYGYACLTCLGWTGYIMQLLAGNEILAQDDNSIYVDDYHWATITVQFITSSSHAQLGNALQIRLLQKNHEKTGGLLLFFDDVRLSASPNTANPSLTPTTNPSSYPSLSPSSHPSIHPTMFPTRIPSKQPHGIVYYPAFTKVPTNNPSGSPTKVPTHNPTHMIHHSSTQDHKYSQTHGEKHDDTDVFVILIVVGISIATLIILLGACIVYQRKQQAHETEQIVIAVSGAQSEICPANTTIDPQTQDMTQGRKDLNVQGSHVNATPGNTNDLLNVYNVKNIMKGSVTMTKK
eukprot:455475_1